MFVGTLVVLLVISTLVGIGALIYGVFEESSSRRVYAARQRPRALEKAPSIIHKQLDTDSDAKPERAPPLGSAASQDAAGPRYPD
jgi:hypothetical protein